MFSRRQALSAGSAGLVLPALVTLAGCGPNQSGGDAEGASGPASLRFAWWGNAVRDAQTNDVIEAYADVDAEVSIAAETGDWSGYWDKLATQTAANDAPDIIQMDEKYISEYGGRGALLDLTDGGLDTAAFEEAVVATGELPDEGLLAICAGINTPVLLANPEIFEEAGVQMPDDETWTWEDLLEISVQITEATEDGVFGVQQLGMVQAAFQVYMRQLGKDQYVDDGVGFEASDAVEFYEYALSLQEKKAAPGADLTVEEANQSLDQTMFATGKTALACAWSNQVIAFDEALGGTTQLLRLPSMTGNEADVGLWYKSSQYYSVNARSENTEAAVAFVDWLVNSEDAGKILLAERGVPGNLDVREAIADDLGESDTKVFDFIDAIADEIGDAPAITPQGGGEFEDMLKRSCEDMLFERTDPAAAGEALFDEISGSVQS